MKRLQHQPGRWPIAPALSAAWQPRDGGRPPTAPASPDFPDGLDLDMTDGEAAMCATTLPFVSNKLGLYVVRCALCGRSIGVTVAGRADDPLAVRVACKLEVTP